MPMMRTVKRRLVMSRTLMESPSTSDSTSTWVRSATCPAVSGGEPQRRENSRGQGEADEAGSHDSCWSSTGRLFSALADT